MKARVARKPGAHRGRLVRAVVGHDQMGFQLRRHVLIDRAQELQKLPGALPSVQLADHFAGGDIEAGKQRCRAVARIVVGH